MVVLAGRDRPAAGIRKLVADRQLGGSRIVAVFLAVAIAVTLKIVDALKERDPLRRRPRFGFQETHHRVGVEKIVFSPDILAQHADAEFQETFPDSGLREAGRLLQQAEFVAEPGGGDHRHPVQLQLRDRAEQIEAGAELRLQLRNLFRSRDPDLNRADRQRMQRQCRKRRCRQKEQEWKLPHPHSPIR